jgi:hypothetical protein
MSWTRQMWGVPVVLTVLASGAQDLTNGGAPELQLSCGLVSVAGWNKDQVSSKKLLEDPATGKTWRLETNSHSPEFPARLIEIPDKSNGRDRAAGERRRPLTIHEGDFLKVSQESAVLHADFAAVAMSGGRESESIRVRLRLSGRIFRAQVLGPARASLVYDMGEVCK